MAAATTLDALQRPLRDLRISVTDRCNFRCTYCMPKEVFGRDYQFLARDELLSYEEIARLARVLVGLGAEKVRLTGGEPLVRPGLPGLIQRLSAIPKLNDIALTTNGVILPRLADDLAAAGLGRVTVSLDTLDEAVLDRMSGGKARLSQILDGISAAVSAGFRHIKINTVVQRGVNDHTILDLLAHFRGSGHSVRLIEYMDVGNSNHWNLAEVVPSAEWVEKINAKWPIRPVQRRTTAETAQRYEYVDGQGEIGLISSISKPFCGGCTRARITADGIFYTCLFSDKGTNLMPLIRHNDDPAELRERIRSRWERRDDRYSEEREQAPHERKKVEMYRMGG